MAFLQDDPNKPAPER